MFYTGNAMPRKDKWFLLGYKGHEFQNWDEIIGQWSSFSTLFLPYLIKFTRVWSDDTSKDDHKSQYLSTIYQLVLYKNISDYMFHGNFLKLLATCLVEDKKKQLWNKNIFWGWCNM